MKYYLIIGGSNTYKFDPHYSIIKVIEGTKEEAEEIGANLSMQVIENNNLVDESKFKSNQKALEAWMKEEYYQVRELSIDKVMDYFDLDEEELTALTIERKIDLVGETADLEKYFELFCEI